eukprot:2682538-Ditylum_brightwellii.AAC.1
MMNQLVIPAIAMCTDFNARRKELKEPTVKVKLYEKPDNNDSSKHEKKIVCFRGEYGEDTC